MMASRLEKRNKREETTEQGATKEAGKGMRVVLSEWMRKLIQRNEPTVYETYKKSKTKGPLQFLKINHFILFKPFIAQLAPFLQRDVVLLVWRACLHLFLLRLCLCNRTLGSLRIPYDVQSLVLRLP